MMQLIIRFIDLSQQAIEHKVNVEQITAMPIMRRLRRMNEDIGEDELELYEVLLGNMESAFSSLLRGEAQLAS